MKLSKMTTIDAIKLVEGATDPARFFGEHPTKKFHEFSILLHPDTTKATGKLVGRAVKAFARLTEMYGQLNGKKAHDLLRIGKWTIEGPMAKGDIADLHYAHGDGSTERVIFKIARSEDDTDLMENEYVHLSMDRYDISKCA